MRAIHILAVVVFLAMPGCQRSAPIGDAASDASAGPVGTRAFEGRPVAFKDLPAFRAITWAVVFENGRGERMECMVGHPKHPFFARLGLSDNRGISDVKDFSGFPAFRIWCEKDARFPGLWQLASWEEAPGKDSPRPVRP